MLKIGFIGCGSISFRHLNNLKEIEDVKVVSVFDPNQDNIKKFEESCGNKINVYRSDEDMIDKEVLDGVVINSPHTFHFKQIKMCLENGIDVLVEKPAVVNFQEAVEIREVMKKTGKKVVVGYQRHYMPVFNEARHIIRENFGDIIYISGFLSQYWFDQFKTGDSRKWRLDPKFSGKGQLTDSGSHFIASLFFLMPLTPEKVSAFIDFREAQVDINTSFIVKFKEGAIGNFGVLGYDPLWREALFIWDDRNNVICISLSDSSYVHFKGEKERREIKGLGINVGSPAEDLVMCIKEKKEPHTSWDIVEKVALLSDMIYKSNFENLIVGIQ